MVPLPFGVEGGGKEDMEVLAALAALVVLVELNVFIWEEGAAGGERRTVEDLAAVDKVCFNRGIFPCIEITIFSLKCVCIVLSCVNTSAGFN